MAFQVDPSLNGYTTERMKIFYPQLSESLSSIPGVQSVGLASVRILEDNEWDSSMSAEGFTPAKPDEHAEPYMNAIGPNYFATLGVPIVAGRDFRTNDNHEVKHGPEVWNWSPTTVIINEKFAKKYLLICLILGGTPVAEAISRSGLQITKNGARKLRRQYEKHGVDGLLDHRINNKKPKTGKKHTEESRVGLH